MTPKGTLGFVLFTHIDQLMTHATNVYLAAGAYLAILLLSLLVYCRESLRAKRCVYHLDTVKVDTFSLIAFLLEKFVLKFSGLFLNFQI